jgi:hypothetical protein
LRTRRPIAVAWVHADFLSDRLAFEPGSTPSSTVTANPPLLAFRPAIAFRSSDA